MSDEFRLAAPHELAALYDLRARAFQSGTLADWAADLERDPWRDEGADLLAASDGRIVATLRLLSRRLAGHGSELRLAGFGAVASDPAVRGQGYVRHLLALAHERNRSAGYDLAMLFTRSPWIYSGSAEFAILPLAWLDLDLHRVPVSTSRWTIQPFDPGQHLEAMREVYEQFGEGRLGYPLRGDAYWAHPARLTETGSIRVALDRDGRVVAYLRLRVARDGGTLLQELPYLVGDAAFALMADLSQDPVVAQSARVGGRLPRDHILGDVGEWSTSDTTMFRAYTPAGARLLAALRDATNQRSVYWSADSF